MTVFAPTPHTAPPSDCHHPGAEDGRGGAGLLEEIERRGVSILLVEQKLTIALSISQRLYVMGHGRIVFEGTPDDLTANPNVRREWLEV